MMFLCVYAQDVHTHSELSDQDGNVLFESRVDNGLARDSRDLLGRALQAVLQSASPEPILTLFALPGLHDYPQRRAASELVGQLQADRRPSCSWLCDSLEPVLAGSLSAQPGMLIQSAHRAAVASVSSQGLVNLAVNEADMLGDEGSALWLGARTLQLALRAQRPGMPRSARLERALLGDLEVDNLEEVQSGFERGRFGMVQLLDLSRHCIELSAYPDPEAGCRALLLKVSRALLALVERWLGSADQPDPPRISWHGPAMGEALRTELSVGLRELMPDSPWMAPAHGPGWGSRLLARAAARVAPEADGEIRQVEESVWREAMRSIS